MKFLKYLLFLLLIAVSGVLLFFATKDGSFEVSESQTIDAPPEVVFNFLNDYKNWAQFGSWNEDETLKMSFPEVTSGIGASYSWESENSGNGAMETLAFTTNEKIVQKIVFNGSLKEEGYEVKWKLEPQENKTHVTWTMNGTWGLTEKIIFYFNNIDMEARLSEMFSESLKSLEYAIENELSKHSILVEGLSILPGSFYVSNTLTSTPDNEKTSRLQLYERLSFFLNSNSIETAGPHFSITKQSTGEDNSIVTTVGIPVKDYLALPESTDIFSGYLEETAAVKVRLTGNHLYIDEAIAQANDYILRNNLHKKENQAPIITFVLSEIENDNPLEWITDIHIPIENQPNLEEEL